MKIWKTYLALAALAVFAGAAWAENPVPLELGAKAPDFELPGVDGKDYTLADFEEAEVLAIVFTCNHCPTSQAYEERLKTLVEDYADKSFALVAVSPNDDDAVRLDELGYSDLGDSFEDMVIRAEYAEFNFPYLFDGETQEMSRKYGPISTPHAFVFDKERVLRYRGRIDDSERPDRVQTHDLRNAIDALLEGEPVPVERTQTVGCATKWSDLRGTVTAAFERWAQEPVELESADADAIRTLMENDTGRLLMVNVWATWCVPCLDEFPELVEINRMYRGRNFDLVTISADVPDHRERALEFLKEQEASMRNLIFHNDQTYDLTEAIDPDWEGGLPYTALIAPGGEVIFRHSGRIDDLEVKRAIVDYLGRTYHQSR